MYEVMKMLEEEYTQKLKKIAKGDDIEFTHREADEALLELLERLNLYEVAEAFRAVPRWYA